MTAAPDDTTVMTDEAIAALKRGNKIEAIKFLRKARGLDLKEAKDAVDAYERQHPEFNTMSPLMPGDPNARRTWTWMLMTIAGAVLMACYLWLERG